MTDRGRKRWWNVQYKKREAPGWYSTGYSFFGIWEDAVADCARIQRLGRWGRLRLHPYPRPSPKGMD